MPRHLRGVSAAHASDGQAKTRRSHRKSRNGCSECKRRHIRCDEGRPACTNCSIAERACSYPLPATSLGATPAAAAAASPRQHSPEPRRQRHPKQRVHNLRSHSVSAQSHDLASETFTPAAPSPSWRAVTPSAGPPGSLPDIGNMAVTTPSLTSTTPMPLSGAAFLYTPQHLALLLHAQTHLADTIVTTRGRGPIVVSIAVRHAVSAPYLIDELLAVSAMHLALTCSPSTPSSLGYSADAASYRHQATELQTRALTSFTAESETLFHGASQHEPETGSTCVTRFLFSAMLAIHVLADCLTRDPAADFHAFVDGFVDCILLHHGVRTFIRPNWEYLLRSEAGALLSDPRLSNKQDADKPNGSECAPLESLLQSSDLNPASIDACREAVSTLQTSFDMQAALNDPTAPNPSSAFAVTVSAEYVNVLRKHRPEALIILAYYGVLLHRSRKCWVFGDSGARIVRAISQNLGSFWQSALAWPLEVVATETD